MQRLREISSPSQNGPILAERIFCSSYSASGQAYWQPARSTSFVLMYRPRLRPSLNRVNPDTVAGNACSFVDDTRAGADASGTTATRRLPDASQPLSARPHR